MIVGHSHILAAGESLTVATTFPAHRMNVGDYASEVTFIVDVQALNGAPTSASLAAKVQGVMPHTTGYEMLNERLFDLDAAQAAALTADGQDWPAAVATEGSAFPVTIQRTYKGFGKDLRLVLTPSFSGGTSPAFVVSVVMHTKG